MGFDAFLDDAKFYEGSEELRNYIISDEADYQKLIRWWKPRKILRISCLYTM